MIIICNVNRLKPLGPLFVCEMNVTTLIQNILLRQDTFYVGCDTSLSNRKLFQHLINYQISNKYYIIIILLRALRSLEDLFWGYYDGSNKQYQTVTSFWEKHKWRQLGKHDR